MKKIIGFFIAVVLFSCQGKREIELPKADKTIVADVQEHSPIYIFFKVNGKDTIAETNRRNAISSTNWIFNIDKRLPLRLVVPEIIKVQAKKEGSIHKSEASENYFSYANDVKKTLAFLPFTKVKYGLEKPKTGVVIYFSNSKEGKIFINEKEVPKDSLQFAITHLNSDKPNKYFFCFDANLSFDNYIKYKIFIRDLVFQVSSMNYTNEEFVY